MTIGKIGLLSLSRIADDPRVRRQGDAFDQQGWVVSAIGLPGARSPSPKWQQQYAKIESPLEVGLRARARRFQSLLQAQLGTAGANRAYWSRPNVSALYEKAKNISADAWIANDWSVLPIAAALAEKQNALLGYDAHEFALEEFAESAVWRFFHRPMIQRIERQYIYRANVISTVSEGIADALVSQYLLKDRPLVVRNMPRYLKTMFRRTPSIVRVLYQGLLAPGRGIESAIESAGGWKAHFKLYIRGPGPALYIDELAKLICRLGLESRIEILPAVPMENLVEAASEFDVGLIALPDQSANNRHALPNKFFEYIMAGLALCVNDLPDIASLIAKHQVGAIFKANRPRHLAETINSLTNAKIDQYKVNSLRAAEHLCWERESKILTNAYAEALALRHVGYN